MIYALIGAIVVLIVRSVMLGLENRDLKASVNDYRQSFELMRRRALKPITIDDAGFEVVCVKKREKLDNTIISETTDVEVMNTLIKNFIKEHASSIADCVKICATEEANSLDIELTLVLGKPKGGNYEKN